METIIIYVAEDGISPNGPNLNTDTQMFSNLFAQRLSEGGGDFVHAEQPDVVAAVTSL